MGKMTKSNLSSNFMMKEGSVIYIDSEQGDDNNNGYTPATAVKTFERAVDITLNRVYTQSQVSFFVKGVIYATPKTQLISAIKVIHLMPYNYYTEYDNLQRPRMVIDTHNTFVFGALEEVNIYNFDIETTDNERGLFIYTCNRATINDCTLTGANKLLSSEFSTIRMNNCVLNCTGINSVPIGLNSSANLSMIDTTFEPNSSTNVALGLGSIVNTINGDPVNLIKGDDSLYFNDINRGIIVESGINENGSYIKYADGTLICIGQLNIEIPTVNANVNKTWNFPAHFVHNDIIGYCNLFASRKVATSNANSDYKLEISYTNNQASTVANIDFRDSAVQTSVLSLLAMGRWK